MLDIDGIAAKAYWYAAFQPPSLGIDRHRLEDLLGGHHAAPIIDLMIREHYLVELNAGLSVRPGRPLRRGLMRREDTPLG